MALGVLCLLGSGVVDADTIDEPGPFTVSAGLVDELDGDGSQVAELSWRPWASPIGLFDQTEVFVGHIKGRRAPLLASDVTFAGIGLRRYWSERIFSGFGVAGVNHQTEALSSGYQFVSSVGLRFDRVSLVLRHLSNASTRGRNRGESYLAIGFSF